MSKHTKGPYLPMRESGAIYIIPESGLQDTRHAVGVVYHTPTITEEEWVANGDLFASAPDLLAAMEAFVRVDDIDRSGLALLSCQGQAMDGWSKLANYQHCISAARAAITKARGQ